MSVVSPHRQSAAEMLACLAHAYGTADTTLAHALVLWDQFMGCIQPNNMLDEMKSRQFATACFMISMKLRDRSHPLLVDLKEITSFCCKDLVVSEQTVLTSLGWDICYVSGEHRIL